ncbi:MAG: PepSY domain-containing protein [Chthoniobacterales bacterium]
MTSPDVKGGMKKNYRLFLAVALTALVFPTAGFAAPSEAELLKQAKITKVQAEEIALAKVPNGKIHSAEIENEHNALVWSFDIVKPGSKNITEVLVNAKTGKIIDVSTENPAAQAKESAADKAASNR